MADTERKPPLKTYRGNCHCTAFVYEMEAPEIQTAHECNCSICYKKAYLWLSPAPGSYRVVKGDEADLTTYTFGDGKWLHKFCPVCATPLMVVLKSDDQEPRRGLNARAIQGLNIRELKGLLIDGAAMGAKYQPPTYSGPEPSASDDNAKMYYGSCHCGAVTLALKTTPLDKEYPGTVIECNCSICNRNGYVWVYPLKDQVVIQGKDNMNRYSFGTKCVEKWFCKTCGVNLTNTAAGLDEEQIANLPEAYRGLHGRAKLLAPLNLRILNGFHVSEIKEPEQATQGAELGPVYVSP
ncbi:glutathione-dependent formaldehyde-activating enzyme [Immersiella caudata]|uniref:Glutathione-dependent formaldehyde-activating enzyme n=1 Tax=Immersiella caudata TaxID=314043 RepID=A0AA39W544_9PEZI|nr:glutathione-dependent formaldehyde-activating enzyme [Immersiella caudata]